MKIEKISESQVKFTLTKKDLVSHNIKLSELAYGSERTQELFREMLDQAFRECGFEAENVPLMIEAIPITSDSIILIVTKVTNPQVVEEKLAPPKPSSRKKKKTSESDKKASKNVSVFSFDDLESVTAVSLRLYLTFNGTNALFKNDSKYFLFLQNDSPYDNVSMEHINSILGEYGQKHNSNVMSMYFLAEHGEVIIKKEAIQVLANI